MGRLNDNEINDKLKELPGWSYNADVISKEYGKKDFSTALAFVVRIGIEAEKADHHPDILIHSWNKIKITLSTHSEGGVTQKDINLAKTIETL